ncbi:hypothetical protein GUJ93_ZPchr0010g7745 [Zizania palustris]|uniref:Uncharacterized protein n=1 Tax=Zizania palustris TaxID=103762 RepID=A0A8J6BP37_ZIZPA|nr:hypothetical protein GUJ93_ZPchr0010g7745 [Zizania palustris]
MASSLSQAVNSTHPPRAQPPHRDSSAAMSPARHPAHSPPPPVPSRASRTSRATAVASCCHYRTAPLPQGCALLLLSRTPCAAAVVPCRSLPRHAAAPWPRPITAVQPPLRPSPCRCLAVPPPNAIAQCCLVFHLLREKPTQHF